jgi:hypothetical protein
MCFQPKHAGHGRSIYASFAPPNSFFPTAMHFPMMTAAEWHSELVADFAAQCRRLGKSQMMRISRTTTTDQARLFGN